jgi:lysozyme
MITFLSRLKKNNTILIAIGIGILVLGLYLNKRQIYHVFYKIERQQTKNEYDKFFAQWKVFGIDVSEYQESIDWDDVKLIFGEHKIYFVFIRATAGKDKVDAYYFKNWKAKKESYILQGAYHYYRPNENSIAQATNFINTVSLKKGNLPPVLDIERISDIQSLKSLKKGIQNWLDKVEKHYGVKPIIYSGSSYFTNYLKEEFKDYPLWIANYNRTKIPIHHNWNIWQYSNNGQVKGIDGKVDINVYDGKIETLQRWCIK